MNMYESITILGLVLLVGSFVGGMTFLKFDLKWKLARSGQSVAEGSASLEEVRQLRQEVQSLREELAALRETSTSFDLSLEAAFSEFRERSVR